MISVILAFALSLVLSLVLVPFLARHAHRVGLVDLPDDKRKLHKTAIPMVGGIALFFSVLVAVPLMVWVGIVFQASFIEVGEFLLGWLPINFARRLIVIHPDDYRELPGLLIGSFILLGVGVLDDRFGIRGRQKLLGQFIAATALIIAGFHFEKVSLLGLTIKFDVFSILFVYAWIIAAINSVNLLDGADGVAATIGLIMSIALSVMAVYQGQMVNAILTISIAGGLLGFLRYNFPPAKAYLGDAGSMLIGFVLAAVAIRCTFKQSTAFAFFAPVALLAIPFIDTGAAIVRRRLTGRSIFAVDRGHLHHALMKQGYSAQVSLLWIGLLCATTAAGGVLSLLFRQSEYAVVSIVVALSVMVGFKIFGVAEFRLISRKANSIAKSFWKIERQEVSQAAVHVQGNRDWSDAWSKLCEFASKCRLVEMTLDLNAPWLHESFHATWKRASVQRGGNHEWYVHIPLIAEGRVFGRIEFLGSGSEQCHHNAIKNVLQVTSDIETSLSELTHDSVSDLLTSPELAEGVQAETMPADPDSLESTTGESI